MNEHFYINIVFPEDTEPTEHVIKFEKRTKTTFSDSALPKNNQTGFLSAGHGYPITIVPKQAVEFSDVVDPVGPVI